MKRIAATLIATGIVLATPGVALAWTNIMEHHGFRYAHGQTWETNYPRVRFYAGHQIPAAPPTSALPWMLGVRGGTATQIAARSTTTPSDTGSMSSASHPLQARVAAQSGLR